MNIVIIGLSLSSSWGNGHATTYRSLIKGLNSLGHQVLFLEREVPWYAENRDLPHPGFCRLEFYHSRLEMIEQYGETLRQADAVIAGSYVPDGIDVIDAVYRLGPRRFCFYDIDTPVTLAALENDEAEYLAVRQIPLFDVYLSFAGGQALERLERQYGAQTAKALFCSVDENGYANSGEIPEWDLGYLGTYSPDRQPTLERLLIEPARRLPEARFVVAGPQYPPEIDWPQNVTRIEHLPPDRHASFYSRQRFTLNVTRADMITLGWAPSVRLFEAAACGTPIISDEWQGLTEILGPGSLVIARSSDDVVQCLTRRDAEGELRMADRARRTVLEKHTGTVRARELVEVLEGISARQNTIAAE